LIFDIRSADRGQSLRPSASTDAAARACSNTYGDHVGVSSRGNGSASRVEPDNASPDHQDLAIELIDAFTDHDTTGLATLGASGRAAQLQARQALYDYVDQIWESAKDQGLDPANRQEWSVVTGLRDLANALVEQAVQAQTEAGDEDPDLTEPDMTAEPDPAG
jgi:hypothetical protein